MVNTREHKWIEGGLNSFFLFIGSGMLNEEESTLYGIHLLLSHPLLPLYRNPFFLLLPPIYQSPTPPMNHNLTKD